MDINMRTPADIASELMDEIDTQPSRNTPDEQAV